MPETVLKSDEKLGSSKMALYLLDAKYLLLIDLFRGIMPGEVSGAFPEASTYEVGHCILQYQRRIST